MGKGSGAKNYGKWFPTRCDALAYIRKQKRNPLGWTPSPAYKYVLPSKKR